jgi:hypothetical protein
MPDLKIVHWKNSYIGLYLRTTNGWQQVGRRYAKKLLRHAGLTDEQAERHIGHLFFQPWLNIPDIRN